MIFGVFDDIHDGHREFLKHAKRQGDYLIAVVTPDHIVHELKGHLPDKHIGDRIEYLVREGLADRIIEGDHDHGSWRVVRRHKPHVIALGYDQERHMRRELEEFLGSVNMETEVRTMPAHKPHTHHSSLLKQSRGATH